MDASIKALLNVSIGWKKYLSQSGAGEQRYESVVTFKCYPQGGSTMVRDTKGELITSTKKLFLDGRATSIGEITTKDLIIYAGVATTILAVQHRIDGKGVLDMVVIYL